MAQISLAKIPKIHRKDLMKYLNSFPQKNTAGKDAAAEAKSIRGQVNFLMEGKQELDATELHALLAQT